LNVRKSPAIILSGIPIWVTFPIVAVWEDTSVERNSRPRDRRAILRDVASGGTGESREVPFKMTILHGYIHHQTAALFEGDFVVGHQVTQPVHQTEIV
jgi:hypothetical protein